MYIGGMLACNIVCVTLLYVLRWTFFIRSETRFNDLYRCEFFPGCAAWYSTLSTLARQLQTRVASAACVEGVHNRPPPTAPHTPVSWRRRRRGSRAGGGTATQAHCVTALGAALRPEVAFVLEALVRSPSRGRGLR
jgi:hypothetical protein